MPGNPNRAAEPEAPSARAGRFTETLTDTSAARQTVTRLILRSRLRKSSGSEVTKFPLSRNRSSAVVQDRHPREVFECGFISADDRTSVCPGGRGDYEIVGASGTSLAPDGDEQIRVFFGHIGVVVESWNSRLYVNQESFTKSLGAPCRQCHTDFEFSDGDGRDRHVILIAYHLIECRTGPVRVDEEGRIEK